MSATFLTLIHFSQRIYRRRESTETVLTHTHLIKSISRQMKVVGRPKVVVSLDLRAALDVTEHQSDNPGYATDHIPVFLFLTNLTLRLSDHHYRLFHHSRHP